MSHMILEKRLGLGDYEFQDVIDLSHFVMEKSQPSHKLLVPKSDETTW